MVKKNNVVRMVLIFTLIMGVTTLFVTLSGVMKANNSSYITIDPDTMELVQLNGPKDGDPIAIVDTTLGEFRFVLYPEYSPNAVANFTDLAEKGGYDDTYVFHSDSGVFSAAGAPNKDGSANDTTHEHVKRELHQNLWPFKGAILAMNTDLDRNFKEKLLGGGTYLNGSRLFLVNTIEFTEDIIKEMKEASEDEKLAEAFIEKGGVPNFSQQMTVIGQTYSGLDVIEKLASLETEDKNGFKSPVEDIKIKSVKLSTYSADEKPSDSEKKAE